MDRGLRCRIFFSKENLVLCVGSLSHLIKDCDYYEKKMAREAAFKSTWGGVHVNSARVTRPVSNQTSYKSSPKFSQVNLTSPKKCFSKQSSPVNRPFSRYTAYKSNKYAVKGKMGTAVKTSAGCVWRKAIPLSNTNSGPTPDSNVNVSRGPQGRPKPVKAWVTRINCRILKNSIEDLLPLEVA
ncbi:hypothetical protein Tco_0490392 [Tanacetum coccineum]